MYLPTVSFIHIKLPLDKILFIPIYLSSANHYFLHFVIIRIK